MKTAVIIPTYNAGNEWELFIAALKVQTESVEKILVIDSGSVDSTCIQAENAGFEVRHIAQKDFNHGGTRQAAVEKLINFEFVILLTQDAVLRDSDALHAILSPFEDSHIAAVCGRQLPKNNATKISAHARLFNYPDTSFVRQLADRDHLGIRAAFLSNSFAAYRVSSLFEVGGFPDDVIFGEDMCVAAKLLLAGYKVAYAADAGVFHSHNYSLRQEFQRYFDMGVMHDTEKWLLSDFGRPTGEGFRFIKSEFVYLLKNAPGLIPEALVRTLMKFAGYKIGLSHSRLSQSLKIMFSMNKQYWNK